MSVTSWRSAELVADRFRSSGPTATAIQHAVSSKSYGHMSRTPALQQALSNAWLKTQGLVSVKDLWCKAQGYMT